MGNSLTVGYIVGLLIYVVIIVWMTQTAKRVQTTDDFMAAAGKKGYSALLGLLQQHGSCNYFVCGFIFMVGLDSGFGSRHFVELDVRHGQRKA